MDGSDTAKLERVCGSVHPDLEIVCHLHVGHIGLHISHWDSGLAGSKTIIKWVNRSTSGRSKQQ